MISRGNTEKTKIRRKINRKSGKIWVTFYYYLLRLTCLKIYLDENYLKRKRALEFYLFGPGANHTYFGISENAKSSISTILAKPKA